MLMMKIPKNLEFEPLHPKNVLLNSVVHGGETQNPDRLDTFDFDKLTLEIITSARKHQTFQKVDNSNVQFRLKFQINRLRNKKVMPY
jgi:hypothetical protein